MYDGKLIADDFALSSTEDVSSINTRWTKDSDGTDEDRDANESRFTLVLYQCVLRVWENCSNLFAEYNANDCIRVQYVDISTEGQYSYIHDADTHDALPTQAL